MEYTPLQLVPEGNGGTCCCYVHIPEGFDAIVTKFGAETNGGVPWEPGFHTFSPFHKVAYLVNKSLVVFDTPVKDCKSADNITVNVDVLIVFKVVDSGKFVYNLGPEKLDGLMRAQQEENLRALASSVNHDSIFELQGRGCEDIVKDMNEKLEGPYGVRVLHFTVKNVRLPGDLLDTMQKKTILTSKEIEQRMEQEYTMLVLNNQQSIERLKEECENMRQAAEEEAVIMKATMKKEVSEVKAESDRKVAEVESEARSAAQQVLADAELEVAKLNGERDKVTREIEAETMAEIGNIRAQLTSFVKEQESQASYEGAVCKAKATQALSEAEGLAAQAFAARRQHEANMKRLDVLDSIAKNQNVRIVGSEENMIGLAPGNNIVNQVVQQGMLAARAKLAQWTEEAAAPPQATMGRA